MEKEIYFGSVELKTNESVVKSLVLHDLYGDSELTISNGEFKNMEDTILPVVLCKLSFGESEKQFLIHKIDCLAVATFLLNIHNDYASEQNTIRLKKNVFIA